MHGARYYGLLMGIVVFGASAFSRTARDRQEGVYGRV